MARIIPIQRRTSLQKNLEEKAASTRDKEGNQLKAPLDSKHHSVNGETLILFLYMLIVNKSVEFRHRLGLVCAVSNIAHESGGYKVRDLL